MWILAVTLALTTSDAFYGADVVILGALVLTGIWYLAVVHRKLAEGTAGIVTPDPEKAP